MTDWAAWALIGELAIGWLALTVVLPWAYHEGIDDTQILCGCLLWIVGGVILGVLFLGWVCHAVATL